MNVQFASGIGGDTLSSMAPLYDTILNSSNEPITGKHSYAGGLIIGVTATDSTHATLALASALSAPLPADTITKYVINQYLYPPPASFSPADPSVLAYAKYAEFLASMISASALLEKSRFGTSHLGRMTRGMTATTSMTISRFPLALDLRQPIFPTGVLLPLYIVRPRLCLGSPITGAERKRQGATRC